MCFNKAIRNGVPTCRTRNCGSYFFHRKDLKATAIAKCQLQEGMEASRLANGENGLTNSDNVLANGARERRSITC